MARVAAGPTECDAGHPPGRPCRLTVLGATGSIGQSTLDLVARNPDLFEVVAVTAQCNTQQLAEIAKTHRAKIAVIGDERLLGELRAALSGTNIILHDTDLCQNGPPGSRA